MDMRVTNQQLAAARLDKHINQSASSRTRRALASCGLAPMYEPDLAHKGVIGLAHIAQPGPGDATYFVFGYL
jgi:hypothetical protein